MHFARDEKSPGDSIDVGSADVDHRPVPEHAHAHAFAEHAFAEHAFAEHAYADFAVAGQPPPLPPAMMAGKGVRAVRCVGCRQDTLPRTEDGAPLCLRCEEVLASVDDAAPETWAAWTVQLTPKWLRRRSSVSF